MTDRRSPRPTVIAAFLQSEAFGGLMLMLAGALALILANSPVSPIYFSALQIRLGPLSILHWINDALMSVFFLLVGLEIKREFLVGELSHWRRRSLPGLGALGGMIVPALVYSAINWGNGETLRGWAIPSATDIAFALGILSLLGSRVPASIKLFLMALAIIDDLGAIVIIAVFYATGFSTAMLCAAAWIAAALLALNYFGVKSLSPYLALGVALWGVVLQSGVHPTVAGVILALTIPLPSEACANQEEHSPLHNLERALQPLVAYFVLPTFGFANAGISFSGLGLKSLAEPVTLGVIAGLVLGKPIGVFSFSIAAIRLKIADKPVGATVSWLFGAAILCGVGFTMSLFIGSLAFPDSQSLRHQTKLGVLSGSMLCGIMGYAFLAFQRSQPSRGAPLRNSPNNDGV